MVLTFAISFLLLLTEPRILCEVYGLHVLPLLPSAQPLYSNTCSYHTCFESHLCAFEHARIKPNQIRVFVFPSFKFTDGVERFVSYAGDEQTNIVLRAVNESKYAVFDPLTACIFATSLDFQEASAFSDSELVRMFQSFPWPESSRNRMIFNFHDLFLSTEKIYELQKYAGFLALGEPPYSIYRPTFDVSLPIYNSKNINSYQSLPNRIYLLTVLSKNTFENLPGRLYMLSRRIFKTHLPSTLAYVNESDTKNDGSPLKAVIYGDAFKRNVEILIDLPTLLSTSYFCVFDHGKISSPVLLDVMRSGCIPVVIGYDTELPFFEKLDWTSASLRMKQFSLEYVLEIISSLSLDEIDSLQTHVRHFFDSHFSSISKVVFSALDIVNERVFPNFAKCQSAWNDPDFAQTALNSRLRIFPHSNSIRRGFTVVLFTQQHLSNLQFLLSHLSSVSESREIFIVWSNPERDPPPSTYLPNTGKPIRILPSPFYNRKQHTVSKLPETESAALFAINADEGPIPSTADIEFAYETWRQHPSRIIGFHNVSTPLKSHVGSSTTPDSFADSSAFPVFFHKYYLSRYLEELSDKLNFLLTSPLDCVELAIPSVVEHLSERPRLNTLRRYNVDITHRYRNATAGGTERTFIEGLDLASRPTDEHGAAQRKKCYQLVETALRQHSGLPVRSVVSYAQPYRATWQYPRRPDQ